MDITQYFQKRTKKKLLIEKEELNNLSKKRRLKQKYLGLLAKMINNSHIDILEYTHMMNFLKSGGSIVNMKRYNQIVDKIKNDNTIDQELKVEFLNVSNNIYSHLYDLFGDNSNVDKNNVDITKLLNGIIKYNKGNIDFTQDQKKGIKNICYFLYDSEIKTYGLYGYAGTGKTTLITKLIHYLLLKNYINSVVFSAPTNKAVNIMKSKFRNDIENINNNGLDEQLEKLEENGFKINFLTIHKLLNYKNDFNVDGERIFIKGNKSNIFNYDLVIVDECSMIPLQIITHIFEDVREQIKLMGKDNIVKKVPKVLFVGDPAQLPPVNEKVSIIFAKSKKEFDIELFNKCIESDDLYFENLPSDKSPNNKYKNRLSQLQTDVLNLNSMTLHKVVRSNDHCVVGLCNEVRSWVIGIKKEPYIGNFKGSKVKLYNYKQGQNKLKTKWFTNCLNYFSQNNGVHASNIILTWTNRQSDDYNIAIRRLLFKKDKLDKFERGDILILKDFYNFKEIEINNENDNIKKFYTSEQIKVTDLENVVRVSEPFDISLPSKLIKMNNFRLIEDQYRKTTKIINNKTDRKYKVWKLYVQKLADVEKNKINETYQIYVIKNESIEKLAHDRDFASNKIKNLRKYYKGYMKDQMNSIDQHIIRHLWKEWNKRFLEPFANVNNGISISVHRSQGSSFYNVFVDAHDILKNKNPNEAKRCIYTALTRTSNEVHILI